MEEEDKIEKFAKGLRGKVADFMCIRTDCKTLDAYIVAAEQVDADLYANAKSRGETSSYARAEYRGRQEFKKSGNGRSSGDATPMDLGNLQERKPRTEDRKCYECGKVGHLARDCPSGGGDQPKKGKGAGRRGRRKGNA